MNNAYLQNLISEFSPQRLIPFLREKNRNFRPAPEKLYELDADQFSMGEKVGEIPFTLYESLGVYAIKVTKNLSERTGKKYQYELAKKVLKDSSEDAGIFVFYDAEGSFRFSLVYANYQGTKRDWSTFRRFTYFVSPQLTNKTFKQQMTDGDFSTLKKITEAFSVEVVTDKFFKEFRNIFDRTRKEFEQANKNTVCLWLSSKYDDEEYKEQVNKFIFTFLGRIIFLYFLLRKGWVEDKIDFIRNKVEDDSIHNLYQNVFEPLFFEVFAKQEKDRSPEIKEQYKNTPYLNGGLFEHSDLETEMAKEGKFILFRDEFLRDIILNYFEIYNFTVDENSPNDQEVSIDPEMLGKVFENTLAEEERNKKGTFYTPREIVHFMVKDSIRQYLHNETGINLGLLQKFIYDEDNDLAFLTSNQIRLIDSKLETIKVLDPAVGSAAFPVEFMQVIIELRKRLNVRVGKHINEVALKKQLIKNNLYGVDIDPSAIEIAKLRLWLALIVDYDKTLAEPLPNLDFQFRVGNSLQEKIDDVDIFNESTVGQTDWTKQDGQFETLKSKMIRIKDLFYTTNDETKRHQLKDEFDSLEHQLIQAVLNNYKEDFIQQHVNKDYRKSAENAKQTLKKINALEQKIKDGTYKLFKPDFHFSEVFDRVDEEGKKIGGFDIVIGNPPYGVTVDNDIKDWHGLGSRDSYGVFISTALQRFLKPKGVLEFIVSDTWLTIKTHKPLREQVLSKQLHKVVRLHQDCFDATVNACIISVTNQADGTHQLIAADLTNISTRDQVDLLRAYLYDLESHVGESTPTFAVYSYEQNLIKTNSNQPIFVGSPKLFALMQDVGIDVVRKEVAGKVVPVRQIQFNGQLVELVRFGDIADVKQGLATGDNWAYLYQNPQVRGSYRNINEYSDYLLTDEDLLEIATNEERRMKVIEFGIHKSKAENGFDPDRWFEGRYIVPYDKGGESDTATGWLPNYYVPTNYFIDWSTWAINRMRTLSIGERDGTSRETIAAVFRNVEYYFREGLTLSYTGQYAPNLRFNSIGVFDVGGSSVFSEKNAYMILGNFACKIIKYLGKTFIDHSVNFQVDENKELPMISTDSPEIINFVKQIVKRQKQEPRYDYLSSEQKEIDQIVYGLYGLNAEDIKEVETWYARRYPKLARLCDI